MVVLKHQSGKSRVTKLMIREYLQTRICDDPNTKLILFNLIQLSMSFISGFGLDHQVDYIHERLGGYYAH